MATSVFQRDSWVYKLASVIVSLAFLTLATLAIYSVLTTYIFQPPADKSPAELGTRSEFFNPQSLENINLLILPVIFLP